MAEGQLPGEGPVRLGPVTLPAGKLIAGYSGRDHVAWATVDPVPKSGRVWTALSELHPRTGLVPIQLDGLGGDTGRPWDDGDFNEPADPREVDGLDAGAVLRFNWRAWVPHPRRDDPELMQVRAPFTLEWPGLAASEGTPLAPGERRQALDVALPRIRQANGATPQARIGLVAAGRPADVLLVIGWGGLVNCGESLLELTAVLRSWEDRFGARLIDVGYADLRLFVERPPRTLEAAQRLAAEQVVLGGDCIDGARDIPGIAARLVNGPIWTFWWD
ncbi:MAG: hypothetical protein JWM19_1361 [Actinomycetia bacterium]|nr:hypothetical protein [Actinomycetes bacterium]